MVWSTNVHLVAHLMWNYPYVSFASEQQIRQGISQPAGFILTTPTICVALHCRLSCCSLPPEPRRQHVDAVRCRSVANHRSWRQFPCRCRPPLVTLAPQTFLDRPVTLPVLWRTVRCTLLLLKHLSCGFNFNFYWKLASKASSISNAVHWLVQLPWRHMARFE